MGRTYYNVHLQYTEDNNYLPPETYYQSSIIVMLAQQLVKNQLASGDTLFIRLTTDDTCRLGYGHFNLLPSDTSSSRRYDRNGLCLDIGQPYRTPVKILELAHQAVQTYQQFGMEQAAIYQQVKTQRIDTFIPLSFAAGNPLPTGRDSILNQLLHGKTYRNDEKAKPDQGLDYYFQDGMFKVYVNFPGADSVILSLENIYELVNDSNGGHLVFSEPYKVYYVNTHSGSYWGPYLIDSIDTFRSRVTQFYYNYGNPGSIYIAFESGEKVLIIPDSQVVISDFRKTEETFLKDLIRQNRKDKDPKEKPDYNLAGILVLLGASVAFNLWLLSRRR